MMFGKLGLALVGAVLAVAVSVTAASTPVPTPTPRQLEWMKGVDNVYGAVTQFMHFGLPTFWVEGDKLNPTGTYHDCDTTEPCTEESCGDYAPCLSPELFQPVNLDPEQWVLTAKMAGFQEICLTAQHEGGFALWPSAYTPYSVAASTKWMGGKGDVLKQFAAAANKHGVGICYYLNVQCNHYLTDIANVTGEEFMEKELGMLTEVLQNYGPVNRMWFDGTQGHPKSLNRTELWVRTLETIRSVSPSTLITSYRDFGGDIGSSYDTQYRYGEGPPHNSTSTTNFKDPSDTGSHFAPNEQVGVCMQEGPTGDENIKPTYWFWHPMVGSASPQRLWHDYLNTTGHGVTLMINVPADRNGSVPAEMVSALSSFSDAIKGTFTTPLAGMGKTTASCSKPVVLDTSKVRSFDFVQTAEAVEMGQRINNYTIEYQTSPTGEWKTLVPPATTDNPPLVAEQGSTGLGDRPAGTDKRDAHVGVRRIDVPAVDAATTASATAIRFVCIASETEDIYLESFGVYKADLPWEA